MANTKEKVFYCKRLLNIFVPDMGSKQYQKNPFTKFVHDSTLTIIRQTSLLDRNPKNMLTKCSNTMLKPPNPVQIPKPCRLDMEDWHSWIFYEESDNEDDAEEIKEANLMYLSKELESDFKILQTLKLPTEKEIKAREVKLPFNDKTTNKTLVLDLDETLIHAISMSNYSATDTLNDRTRTIKVIIRPYAIEFLKELSKLYEIVVLYIIYFSYLLLVKKIMLMLF